MRFPTMWYFDKCRLRRARAASKWCSVSSQRVIEYSSDQQTLIRLHVCAGWSEPLLVAHTTLLENSCTHGSMESQFHSMCVNYRTLVKSAYQKNDFLIFQPKHMLWVLKRTVSMRRFFWAPETYAKIHRLENINNFTLKFFVYLNLWLILDSSYKVWVPVTSTDN